MNRKLIFAAPLCLVGCAFTPAEVPSSPDVDRIAVSTDSGDVDIRVSNVSEPTIRHRHGTFSADSVPSVGLSQDGSTLLVSDGCDKLDATICHVDFEIELPNRPYHVHLSSDSGDLKIAGLTGSVSAETDSSNLQITNGDLQSLDMTTDSGDAELRHTKSKWVRLASDSGRLDADDESDVGTFEKASVK